MFLLKDGSKVSVNEKGPYDTLEDARLILAENALYGARIYDEKGNLAECPFPQSVSDFFRELKFVTDTVRIEGFVYGDAPINPGIDHSACIVSCDRMVSWALYRMGYTNQPYKQGLIVWAPPGDLQDLGQWCAANSFTRIDSVAQLQPGDIVFVNVKGEPIKNGAIAATHTFVHGGWRTEKLAYRYDCGKNERLQSVQPFCEPIKGFLYAYRLPDV